MGAKYRVKKTIEGKVLQVLSLEIQRIDSIAKRRKVLGGEYLHNKRGEAIGREYFTYTKSPVGGLVKTIPEDFLRDLRNLSYIKQAGILESFDEKWHGSRFIGIEKSIKSIRPLSLRPKEYEVTYIKAQSLYSDIKEYKADYLDSLSGWLFKRRINIPADLNFTKALLWLQKKYNKLIKKENGTIHEEDAWGLGKPFRPLLFLLKKYDLRTFVVRIEKAERDIYKKLNYLEILIALMRCQSYLEKISQNFLKGRGEEELEKDIFYKPPSFLKQEPAKLNQVQYTQKVLEVRKRIKAKIDPQITKERLGVTLSRIAKQKRDQIIYKYEVY